MKILFVHNEYAAFSGEENSIRELTAMLREGGHEVELFTKSSSEIGGSFRNRVGAFFKGICNPSAAGELDRILERFRPDIVQVQNIYPFISSAIFPVIRKRGIPIVMRCPNYRLFCPNGLCLRRSGEVCEECFGGREYCCLLHNCEGNPLKSLGYALRNRRSRVSGHISDNVDIFIVQSQFQREKFAANGIPEEKIRILPGICPEVAGDNADGPLGDWVSYVGRVSPEKGIYEFIGAAADNPGIPFKVAGAPDKSFRIPDKLPSNIEFLGFLGGEELDSLYRRSRIIVVPSKWYEGFPNVITMAMMHARPVVTTDIGAMPSIITDGVDGRVVPPASAKRLGEEIASLYSDVALCREYGLRGRERACRDFSRVAVYGKLMEIYKELV